MTRSSMLRVFIAATLMLVHGPALAAVLYVAANGTDAASCGAIAHPCLTITQAIFNAADGDLVMVGPGLYGDVDGDGRFASTADEPAHGPSGCDCVIDVNKRVTLESSAGAAATIIDGGSGAPSNILRVGASGAIVGRRNHGFTIRGGFVGIFLADGASGVRIEGNVVDRAAVGIGVGDAPDAIVIGDVVRDTGFLALVGGGPSTTVSGNVVAMNNVGMWLFPGTPTVTNNFVIGNGDPGIEVGGGPAEIRQNTITGQRGRGIHFASEAPGGYAGLAFTGNNIFANATALGTNCGADSDHGEIITAERNYWGRIGGPGSDPADQACGLLDTSPFATRAFPIANTAGR